ncbi:MAG: SUMF1/EgtB/PvdO family nonheme iron enzyme [Magnetococcales bacterium]|nr:SUMF1/EgtB/PvdO family nonheme iron enzyme [Magnetococcales bacterium]
MAPGTLLGEGRYRVEEVLGEGAFGQIYKVTDLSGGVIRALKRARYTRHRRLFAAELEHLSRLKGAPHVLPLTDHFVDEDRCPVFVTEYLDAGTLKEWILSRGCLSIGEAFAVLDQLCQALAAAQALDPPIVHRDIKPSNVFGRWIGPQRRQWYLCDWGLSASWSNAREPMVSGTYSYTAPEVWEQRRYLVSDVYSLGMSLYFMVFGCPAYDGATPWVRQLQRAPEPVVMTPSTPPRLRVLLQGMLEKKPEQRWPLSRVIDHLRGDGGRPRGILVLQSRQRAGRLWRVRVANRNIDFSWIPARNCLKETASGLAEEGHFWMSRHPVTRGLFEVFVRETGYVTRAERQGWGWIGRSGAEGWVREEGVDWRHPGFAQGDDHPVVLVDHADAQAYIRWLATKTGRWMWLPSEYQWQTACMAGMDDLEARESETDVAATRSVLVNPMLVNVWGLVDMIGHVYEWTGDMRLDVLERQESRKFPGRERKKNNFKVICGSSWYRAVGMTAYRAVISENECANGLGFRVAGLALSWER